MNFVFVYGSLKKGFHNNKLLEDSTFLGAAITEDMYDMFSYGSFPAVVEDGTSYKIKGEVYYVSDETLKDLDMLEDNGRFYMRKKVDTDKYNDVWFYFLHKDSRRDLENQSGIQIINKNTKVWVKH